MAIRFLGPFVCPDRLLGPENAPKSLKSIYEQVHEGSILKFSEQKVHQKTNKKTSRRMDQTGLMIFLSWFCRERPKQVNLSYF